MLGFFGSILLFMAIIAAVLIVGVLILGSKRFQDNAWVKRHIVDEEPAWMRDELVPPSSTPLPTDAQFRSVERTADDVEHWPAAPVPRDQRRKPRAKPAVEPFTMGDEGQFTVIAPGGEEVAEHPIGEVEPIRAAPTDRDPALTESVLNTRPRGAGGRFVKRS